MTLMTTEEIRDTRALLGFTNPASAELVTDALRGARQIERQADRAMRRVLGFLPPIIRRLLDAETERNTIRTTIARLVVANNHGDDLSLSDLAWELQRAGVELKHEFAEAEDLHRAASGEACL